MPVFYLNDNLTIGGKLYKKGLLAPLKTVSEKSLRGLVSQGIIRELKTPPISTFEPLRKYATILGKAEVQTLGDFAFADLSQLQLRGKTAKGDLETLQAKVKELIKPGVPLPIEDCGCGESPAALPKHQE
jgi:hypothetical protein